VRTAALFVFLPTVALAAPKPAWVDGNDPHYASNQYLLAVGYGPQRATAEGNALANLSKIFEAQVSSASKDYQAAFSAGKSALEVQSVETLTQVSTKKLLTGVKIVETWDDGKGVTYCLAALERSPAAASVRERIAELDKKIGSNIEKATATDDKVKKVTVLRNAAKDLQERMALNGELRIIAPDGQGVPAEHSAGDISAQLEGAADELNIGVQVSGSNASDLTQALTEGLSGAGFQVKAIEKAEDDEDEEEEASAAPAGDFDLLVRAKSRMEKATIGAGPPQLARVVVDVELFNPAKKKVVTTFNVSKKEGHNSIEEAARRAVRSMKAELVKKISEAIQAKLGPKG
jgi:hypothetical protein